MLRMKWSGVLRAERRLRGRRLRAKKKRLQRYFSVPPTRLENGAATVTTPSVTFRPREGKGRGAGPPITSAPFLGSKTEPWHEQTKALRSFAHMFTGQAWCVHTAE